jgi:DNA-binding Lrp family transcriptional regulator
MVSKSRPERATVRYPPDPLDLKILTLLAEDGSLGYKQLAQRTNADKRTIAKHVEDLKKRRVLKISAEIDWQAIGVGALAFVGTMTALGDEDVAKLYEYIRKEPRVIEAYSTIGSDEYFLTVVDVDLQTLREEVLRKLEPLTADLSTAIVSRKIKERDYAAFLAYLEEKTRQRSD